MKTPSAEVRFEVELEYTFTLIGLWPLCRSWKAAAAVLNREIARCATSCYGEPLLVARINKVVES